MNKILLTSVASLALVFPAFADIDKSASTATCDSDTIGATSGNAYMDTAWTANTINLQWYSNGEQIDVTGTDSATCTYDGTITLPSDPQEPTGYTFGGWKVRVAAAPAQCDLSGLSDIGATGRTSGYAKLNGEAGTQEDKYGLTQGSGEWATEFYYGIVKGQARCSLVGEGISEGQTGNPTDDLDLNNLDNGARYCWCKMISFTPKPWTYDTGNANSSPIYLTGYTNSSTCRIAITDFDSTNVRTLLKNASVENPQLITNATGANLAYLTEMKCTTSGAATGHFEEIGDACHVLSSWVFRRDAGSSCARECAWNCAGQLRINSGFRTSLFGAVLE